MKDNAIRNPIASHSHSLPFSFHHSPIHSCLFHPHLVGDLNSPLHPLHDTIVPPGFGFHPNFLPVYKPYSKMKRMFSKKGLVESSKDEKIEDVESDADLQEYVLHLILCSSPISIPCLTLA